ncbi:hypothetical protein [Burkholderia multivorans]|uniref:hypothetical protein n=1 Tax=Burkholderia multivorans TaxID=87883 RepID=UPI0021BEE229|nr:hypothetical protein [Burkholderia multivorans]
MVFCIRRDRKYAPGIKSRAHWDGKRFVEGEQSVKGYVRRSAAEKALARLLKKCQAFSDECSIVEFK